MSPYGSEVTTVMMCGVGGQGTILAADLLAKTAAAEGYDVKLSEVHGMSQRGGAVDSVVRFGSKVYSPVTDLGHVDCLLAFELIEARRQLPYLKRDGFLLVDSTVIAPLSVSQGSATVPNDIEIDLDAAKPVILDAAALAYEAGNPRSANVVLLGALSTRLPFSADTWKTVIEGRVPSKTVEINLHAFDLGRAAATKTKEAQ